MTHAILLVQLNETDERVWKDFESIEDACHGIQQFYEKSLTLKPTRYVYRVFELPR